VNGNAYRTDRHYTVSLTFSSAPSGYDLPAAVTATVHVTNS
jgi:hypothetical protein